MLRRLSVLRRAARRWGIVIALCVGLSLPGSALAQTVEVGGTIGTDGDASVMLGGQAGALWGDRLETSFRARFDRPKSPGPTTYYVGVGNEPLRLIYARGNRLLLTSHVLYHFRRGNRVRPFLGVGIGAIRGRTLVRCEVAGCEVVVPRLPLGEFAANSFEASPIGGIAAAVGNRFIIRGNVQFRPCVCEEAKIFETFIGLGYRFGRWF